MLTFVIVQCSMRVLPHHQDTGGFFIAVLEKKSLLPWEDPKTGLRYYNWNKKLPWEDVRFIRLAQVGYLDIKIHVSSKMVTDKHQFEVICGKRPIQNSG